MPKPLSAGLLPYRHTVSGGAGAAPPAGPEVLLAHMGGPYFARRDDGAWTIPKGEFDPAGEEPLAAARREFAEELGVVAPAGLRYLSLGRIRQRSGKEVLAWAVELDIDAGAVTSNTFEIEWPPRSGRRATFPEIDRAAWFALDAARRKVVAGQEVLLDRLLDVLTSS